MTTTFEGKTALKAFADELRTRANAQYQTRQSKRLFAVPLTLERARVWALQQSLWVLNRRDCWAFAQALAPFDVKQMIWAHEQDELDGNKIRGVDNHFALLVQQGALLNLTADDYRNVRMHEGTRTCTYAWLHLVKDSPWLKAVSACACLEISNSTDWVDGGGMSIRRGKLLEEQLGIPFEKQIDHKEHAVVDVEHGHMLMRIAERHAGSQQALDLMMEGVVESWEIDTVWRSQVAEMMEAVS
jgi:hypothetical protein